ncbi:MAG: type II toxin-antitoxin system VapC family toxin [Hyphomonadaceae bacterium]|nr:type II toxin-antitoxin system VapC family toxin [Hyphomonadaceae bacterium]
MIGLDTNILLRWLILPGEDDLGSSDAELERASQIIFAESAQFFVNAIVIAETAWVLEQKLKLDRSDVLEVIERLLHAENITVGNDVAVRAAQMQFKLSSANFADCLIAQLNLAAGCSHTLTFDRKAGRTAGFRHVEDQ